MVNRRTFLRTAGGLAGTLVTGGWPRTASADPVQSIQTLIDDYAEALCAATGRTSGSSPAS